MEEETNELDFSKMSIEELESYINSGSTTISPTVSSQEPITESDENTTDSEKPTTELSRMQKLFGKGNGFMGTTLLDYSGGGFIYDEKGPVNFYKPGGIFQQRMSATGQGLVDTGTDVVNMLTPQGIPDVPKVPEYEEKTTQALRNISGLVIPSLTLRSMMINAGAKWHAAGTAAPWLQKLGNSNSFQFFSKFGIDLFSGGMVDYVAEQNQKDDNLLGTLKKYWPKTFQWISDRYATTDADSPDVKRSKNVNEGAIFSMLASVVEGVAYLTKAGRSIQRTSNFVPTKTGNKKINELTKDRFADINFSDSPVEDTILRNYARKEHELDLLGEYYLNKGEEITEPTVGIHDLFDENETLVIAKSQDGIIGAASDQAQIVNNIDTEYGRLGNPINEAARKAGIEPENLANRTLVTDLTDQLTEAGRYGKKLNSGKLITAKMIDDAGKNLAAILLNPRIEPEELIKLLDGFKKSIDGSIAKSIGKKGISRAIKQLKEQLVNIDAQKARAYLVTSEAGQIADMAEGVRLMDEGPSIRRSVDLMADRLEVLMVEKGLANFESNALLKNMEAWEKAVATGDFEIMNAAAETIVASNSAKLFDIIPKAKAWSETIKEVARENPNFLKPFLLANEFTDGNVDSMFKLHQDAANRLGVFKKAIVDLNPSVPSIVNKVWWSNLFNSTLSAMSTPAKAALGNLTGLTGRGLATVAGAVAQGDVLRAKKAMIAHFTLDDTLQQANKHMRLVFRKASTNPKEVSYIMREDIKIASDKAVDYLRHYAEAASKEGEYGAEAMLNIYDDLEALSLDPVLRFGGNAMTAFDGFAKSVTAMTEAKYTVLARLAETGEELTDISFRKAVQEVYDSKFNSQGMISDESIDAITSEIALNADSPIVEGMNEFIKRFPAARSFIRFPRTTANVIDSFGRWSPAGILSKDHWDMWGPLGRKKLTDFTFEEMAEILQRKGRVVDGNAEETFQMLRLEVKGKAAIGSLLSLMAFNSFVNDRCTGTGHYNKAIQRQRVKSGWKPKTCKVPGTDKRVSYEWMGPVGDWLSLIVDIADNSDTLGTALTEDLGSKAMYLISAQLTNRSILAQLEPLHDVLMGNGAAATRFASSFLNDTLPLGGFRNELGKALFPGLRQLRNELDEAIRNRNAWLDAFDRTQRLPPLVDPVDGTQVGVEDNWFIRSFNAYSPIKITSNPSKERQFLIDIEFNSSPMMKMSNKGVVLENHEISLINSKMGEMGQYKSEIQAIMKDANKLTYTLPDGTVIKGFVNIVKYHRKGGISSELLDTGKYGKIYMRLRSAYIRAKKRAEMQLQYGNTIERQIWAEIKDREYKQNHIKRDQETGNLNYLDQQNINETLSIYK